MNITLNGIDISFMEQGWKILESVKNYGPIRFAVYKILKLPGLDGHLGFVSLHSNSAVKDCQDGQLINV